MSVEEGYSESRLWVVTTWVRNDIGTPLFLSCTVVFANKKSVFTNTCKSDASARITEWNNKNSRVEKENSSALYSIICGILLEKKRTEYSLLSTGILPAVISCQHNDYKNMFSPSYTNTWQRCKKIPLTDYIWFSNFYVTRYCSIHYWKLLHVAHARCFRI